MTNQDVIETLRAQAASDPVTNAVLHMWALRKRSRNEVTVAALASRMKREGFKHGRDEYLPLLKLMSRLGLGRLHTNPRGRITGIKQVETTLQSLGKAVVDVKQPPALRRNKKKNRFAAITLNSEVPAVKDPTPVKQREPISITVEMGDKTMTFPIGAMVTEEEEVGYMVGKFVKFLASL